MDNLPKRVFVTDCEGPITKNDNAAELAEAFIPRGDRLFKTVSLYDDYLAEVAHKPGYKAGDTLRLILPFLKAFGLDDRSMGKFCRRNILMIPDADVMLRGLLGIMPSYIVSTSYAPYIKGVCDAVGFPFQNTFSTPVQLDAFQIPDDERQALRELHGKIVELPDFTLPRCASSPADLADKDRETVAVLDDIFWRHLPEMQIYRIVEEVNPVGGREKALAIEKIVAIEETELRNVIYVGDSITDMDAFRLVKSGGGMALSFNGNDWAVREASYAVTAQTALPIGWLATLFLNQGTLGFKDLAMEAITAESMDRMSVVSSSVRKSVRTEKIGALG
jgi:energy-converting hydrogenase A subunit R